MVGDNVGLRLVRKLKANTFTITLSKDSKFLEQAFAISAIGVANEEWVSAPSATYTQISIANMSFVLDTLSVTIDPQQS